MKNRIRKLDNHTYTSMITIIKISTSTIKTYEYNLNLKFFNTEMRILNSK